jgi:hypothetical protein
MRGKSEIPRKEHIVRHTPGPWAWFKEKYDFYLGTPDRGRLFVMGFIRRGMTGGQPTFSVWEGEDRERLGGIMEDGQNIDLETHPDARLIASAPDLLAALKRVRKGFGGLLDTETDRVIVEAIEKAEGKPEKV